MKPRNRKTRKGEAGFRSGESVVIRVVGEALNRLQVNFGERRLRVLVGFSGGVDSTALLLALNEQALRGLLSVTAVHVDHGFRAESSEEAVHVKRCCASWGIECHVVRLPDAPPSNREAWGRKERYRAFESVRSQISADVVAVGHHEQDAAETLLIRLISGRLRSSGVALPEYDDARRIWRPVVAVSCAELRRYCKSRLIAWREDSSNTDLSIVRNSIRHRLLPALAEYNPQIVRSLFLTAERLNVDEEYLWSTAADALAAVEPNLRSADNIVLLPSSIRWRALALLARKDLGESARELGHPDLVAVNDWLMARPRCDVCLLRSGIQCRVDWGGGVSFVHISTHAFASAAAVAAAMAIDQAEFRRGAFENFLVSYQAAESFGAGKVSGRGYDEDWVAGRVANVTTWLLLTEAQRQSLVVRWWNPGDVVRLQGRGSRKLGKLFQEYRIPVGIRTEIPVIACDDEVLWVPGVAVAVRTHVENALAYSFVCQRVVKAER